MSRVHRADLQIVLRYLGEQAPDQRGLHRHVWIVQDAVYLMELPGIIFIGHVLRLLASAFAL
jgi:hypothetical protein